MPLAVVAGMKKPNDDAEPIKVECFFFYIIKITAGLVYTSESFLAIVDTFVYY